MFSALKIKGEKYYYLFSEGIVKASILILFPFFTEYLSKDDFGKLSLFWISVPFLSLFIDFSQRSYVKKVYITQPGEIKATIYSLYIFCSIIFFVYILFRWLYGIGGQYFLTPQLDYFVILSSFLFVIIEVYLSYIQIKGIYKRYAVLYILKALFPYVLTVLIFLFAANYGLATFPIVQITVFGLVCIIIFRWFTRTFGVDKIRKVELKQNLVKSLSFGAPLILGTLSATGLNVADRYIISYFDGDANVANYTVAYTIASILSAFYLATNKWWQRFILNAMKENALEKVRSVIWKYILAVLVIAAVIFLFRKQIVLLISNETYLEIVPIIPVLLIGMLFYFLYTLLFNIPFYFGKTTYVVMPAVVAFIVNLLLNFILIPIVGYKVAALTTAISYFLEFTIMYIVCIRKYKIDLLFSRNNQISK